MDYARIRESRGGLDGAPESTRQRLETQIEGTTTWDEVCNVCYTHACTNVTQFVMGGRSCMRVSAWSLSVMSPIIACISHSSFSLIPIPHTETIHFAYITGPHDDAIKHIGPSKKSMIKETETS